MKLAKFATRFLGSTLAVAALAPAAAQATTLKSLECAAYNIYGVAHLTFDAKTNVITSVVNYGQFVFNYRVAGVEAKNQPVEEYAASGAGIELQNNVLAETSGRYKLLFPHDLVVGKKQYVSGQFIHYTREERKAEEGRSTLPADLVTPISLVNCTLELGS